MTPCLLADDLSGALEAGATFRTRGWKVVLPLTETGPTPDQGEMRVIATESRNLAPAEAAAAVRRAVAAARRQGMRLLFKKVDSTLRGPLGAELQAVIDELAPPLLVVCPANPAAGRVVRDGRLLVNGVPLEQTDFRHDPLWPARESRIGALLAAQGSRVAAEIRLPELRDGRVKSILAKARDCGGPAVVVCDAEQDTDLETLMRAVRDECDDAVLVGAGALAARLAGTLPPPDRVADQTIPAAKPVLILCGSRHPASQRQLVHLAARARVPVVSFVSGQSDHLAVSGMLRESLAAHGAAAVKFDSNHPSAAVAARQLQAEIGEFARREIPVLSPRCLYLTGGETAWTVCQALHGSALEILAELSSGVALAALSRQNENRIFVITKPGGFGADEEMLKHLEFL